ncbi:MAG: VCBS repeat-containing protein [Candidatus Lambdaproteobacteria bacterium]|nr:VCBS repeat-containing protein [Candidatus Lambdaproteobacteria bacterium]
MRQPTHTPQATARLWARTPQPRPLPPHNARSRRSAARPGWALLAALALLAGSLGACTDYNPNPDEFKPTATTNADFTAHDIVVGDLPSALDVADTNSDDIVDLLVVANTLSRSVQVLTHDGALNFSSTTLAVNAEPSKVLFADLDGGGAGQIDAVAYAVNDRKLVLLTNDGGTWSTQTMFFTDIVHSLAAVDLNGDGSAADLLLTFPSAGNLSVMVNDGAGALTTLTTALCDGASAFVADNFDTDANLDLAVLCYAGHTVRILLGDGAGGFTEQPAGGYTLNEGPLSIVAADFNADGNRDLAIANNLGASVSILLGDGAGGFTVSHLSVSGRPEWLTVGRFDGVNESVAVNHDAQNVLTVLLGDGTGGFTTRLLNVSEDPYALAVGDFSGDGSADLFSLELVDRVASVLAGDGSGGFTRSVIGFDETPAQPRTAKFSAGAKDDLLLLHPSLDRLTILQNRN